MVYHPRCALAPVGPAGPGGPLNLWYLKTDMQGSDFTALVGGGDLLKHIQYIKTEVW